MMLRSILPNACANTFVCAELSSYVGSSAMDASIKRQRRLNWKFLRSRRRTCVAVKNGRL